MKHSAKLIPFVIAFSAATALGQAPRDKSAPEASSHPTGREVFISLTDCQMTIKQGDTVLASYPIAIGRPSHPTPTGEFHVIDMDDNPTGAPNISGRWLGFLRTTTKGGRDWFGIHGTQKSQSIGRPTSHGCIRLRVPDAIEAFSLLAIGDPIHIGPPPSPRAGRKRNLPRLPHTGRSVGSRKLARPARNRRRPDSANAV
jgi:lipoprotein-anchoring transpeptidase ErfK/SrfK